MYREFYFLIEVYFRVLNKKEAIYEIGIPILIATISFVFNVTINKDLMLSIINIMPIIFGFAIVTIALLSKSENTNLKLTKNYFLDKKIFGKDLTLYKKLLTLFFYIAFIAMLELTISILTITFEWYNKTSSFFNLLLIFHLLLVTIRNITNLFFIELK